MFNWALKLSAHLYFVPLTRLQSFQYATQFYTAKLVIGVQSLGVYCPTHRRFLFCSFCLPHLKWQSLTIWLSAMLFHCFFFKLVFRYLQEWRSYELSKWRWVKRLLKTPVTSWDAISEQIACTIQMAVHTVVPVNWCTMALNAHRYFKKI